MRFSRYIGARGSFVAACAILLAAASVGRADGAGAHRGQQIYADQCARCHGKSGEGVANEYGKPLIGDHTVEELARTIEKTMPEDDPGTCRGEDARQVARYVYDAFYSPVAQARNQPARIELARLTVRQYQQTVADLVGRFRWNNSWDEGRGLKAEYFKSKSFRNDARVLERIDATVDFDFGEASPLKGKIPAEEFALKWQGGLLAPETGEYEFILDSKNAARLWVNDHSRPLIDASVKSGTDTVHRESLRLLGGRVYPIRVEMSKNKESKDKSASIHLRWKMPRRAEETIPARNLSAKPFPVTFVLTTPFPPDDRSVGYERGTSVSKAWQQATTDAAYETAEYVAKNLDDLSKVRPDAPDRPKRLREFARQFAERAFRHPLSDEERRLFVDRSFERTSSPEAGVQRVVLLALLSPRFLYPTAGRGQSDSYDVAARLALDLWDSLPDHQLEEAAASGRLATADQVRRQAQRMAADLRTRSKLHSFFLQWLNVDRFADLAKDTKRFPEFDAEIVSDLRTALDLFLDDVLWSENSDFRQLLVADWLYLNGRLAKFYGADLPADAPFQKVVLNPGERAGVLTHPYLMAGFAYASNSSPIHRGIFVARSVLGRALRPPPEAVAPLPAELHASLTTRERVALQTKAEACQACHRMINPLGFAFENFDAVGRFRQQEQGKPIDATGIYQTRSGDLTRFEDVHQLAEFLARNDETHEAFVEQLFHYCVKQPVRAYGPATLGKLESAFAAGDWNVRKLLVEIAVTAAMNNAPTGPRPKPSQQAGPR